MSDGYESREWIPWYVDDAASWLALSLAARGAAEGIARKMGRRRAELPLGSRGLKALPLLLGRPAAEVEPAIAELLSPGPDGEPPRLTFDAERNVLIDTQAAERQRAVKSTARTQKARAKAANSNDEQPDGNAGNVPVVPVGGGNVPNALSPLLSSSEITDQDRPSRSPMRAHVWELDSKLPDNWREDARSQIEPSGETVDIPAQWKLYLSDRLRPEQAKNVGLADWRGWILRAIGFAKKDRAKAREHGPPRERGGGTSAAGRKAFMPKPTGTE